MTLEQTLEFKIWTHQWEAWTRVWEGEPFPLKSCIICLILFLMNIAFTQGLPVGHIVLGQPKEGDCWCCKPKHPETSQSFFSGEFNQGPVRHIRQASLQVAQNTTDIRLASLPRLKRRKYEWWNWWEIDLTLVWRVRVTLYCAQNLSAKMFGHNVGGEMLGGLHQWQNQPHACLLLWCICAQCATRLSTSLKIPMHTSGHHVWRAQFSLRQPLRLLTYTSVLSGFAMMRNQF